MTPEEAVKQLTERLTTGRLETVKKLIDACVATAKADETRRCAARVKRRSNATCDTLIIAFGKGLANDILVTGGLDPEG